jgi:hypothetical protein
MLRMESCKWGFGASATFEQGHLNFPFNNNKETEKPLTSCHLSDGPFSGGYGMIATNSVEDR